MHHGHAWHQAIFRGVRPAIFFNNESRLLIPRARSLWAVMRLQVIPANLGGAGANRIEWEFDDAVFKEAAYVPEKYYQIWHAHAHYLYFQVGRILCLKLLTFSKGSVFLMLNRNRAKNSSAIQVLAFEETPSLKTPDSAYGHQKYSSIPTIHSRAQTQPASSHQNTSAVASTIQPKRARAPSDPFLDAPQSASLVSSSPSPSFNNDSLLASSGTDGDEAPQSPVTTYGESLSHPNFDDGAYDDAEEQYLRVWTSPDLSNPEFLRLIELFPVFVSRRPLPRFPVPQSRHVDIEEGEDEGLEGRQIQFGTGSMWVSSKVRTDAWEGSFWTMFISWWRKLFC